MASERIVLVAGRGPLTKTPDEIFRFDAEKSSIRIYPRTPGVVLEGEGQVRVRLIDTGVVGQTCVQDRVVGRPVHVHGDVDDVTPDVIYHLGPRGKMLVGFPPGKSGKIAVIETRKDLA